MESCTSKEAKVQKSKIVGITTDGEEIETECIEYHRIVRTWIIIKHYEKWSKHMITYEGRDAVANTDLEGS